jgi:hypothetical protein
MKKALIIKDNVFNTNITQVSPVSAYKCYFEIVLMSFNKYFALSILVVLFKLI